MTDTTDLPPALQAALARIHATRDRDAMAPTIAALEGLLAADPGNAVLQYEVGGAHDTAGHEAVAAGHYERALAPGLSGDALRRLAVQYGSTLRNLGRVDESLAVLDRGLEDRPDSAALRTFQALSLHAAGRADEAVAVLLGLVTDLTGPDHPDIGRYVAAVRGNAAFLQARAGAEPHVP